MQLQDKLAQKNEKNNTQKYQIDSPIEIASKYNNQSEELLLNEQKKEIIENSEIYKNAIFLRNVFGISLFLCVSYILTKININ